MSSFVPLVASFLVFGLGLYLTVQAVAGSTTLLTRSAPRRDHRRMPAVSLARTLC